MISYQNYQRQLAERMEKLEATGRNGEIFSWDTAFRHLRFCTEKLRDSKRTIYCIGNGASASIASHFSADMAKNGHLHTEVFSDLALITAISNDIGYEEVFSEPLRRRAVPGDMLVAISSSGNSPNILRAVQKAKELELTIITLSAMKPDNRLRTTGDLNFYFPAETYGYAESLHASLLHYWIDMFLEDNCKKEN